MHFIERFKEGDRIADVYLCKSKSVAVAKTGKEYGNVMLQDRTGSVDAKIWDLYSGGIGDFEAGDYVHVSGTTSIYNGNMQLKIDRIRVADENEYVISDYIQCSRFDIEEMYKELLAIAATVTNPYIKKLLAAFFEEDSEFIAKFKSCSAAKSVHHAFMGGLLEHSLSVTRMCEHMTHNYDFLNHDLLVACAMLHDCGKTRELSAFPKNEYTDEGNYLGHIVMGYEMVSEKIKAIPDFPASLANEIEHCILAHHGQLEYGSPKKPSIAEALALSYADDCDAKMETMREALDGKESSDWLGYNKWIDANIRKTVG